MPPMMRVLHTLALLSTMASKIKHGLARVLTRQLIRRLCSAEARELANDFRLFAFRSRFIAMERLMDVYRALRKVEWREASLSSLANVLLNILGGTFVKIAQVLACSPGLLPASLVAACKTSLADVQSQPIAPEDIRLILEQELGQPLDSVYATFDLVPMAQASIAQVHAAQLVPALGGGCVCVKIVRPGVRARLTADLELAVLVARLADLLLGAQIVSELVSSSLAHMVGTLSQAIIAETDLSTERENIIRFREWLHTSHAVRRADLRDAVVVPTVYPIACSEGVLTMQRLNGPLLADCAAGHVPVDVAPHRAAGEPDAPPSSAAGALPMAAWKHALSKAMAVTALSLVEDGIFHADLHMGNVMWMPETSQIGIIDFGVCGSLPPWLKGALMLQALSFVADDDSLLAEGFSFAMRTRPAREAAGDDDDGHEDADEEDEANEQLARPLDVEALTAALRPLLAELEPINPFGQGAGEGVSPALYALIARGQLVLAEHGVQLPHEFTLLIKTGIFACAYLGLFEGGLEQRILGLEISNAAAAYAVTHCRAMIKLIPPHKTKPLTKRLASQLATRAYDAAKSAARRRVASARAALDDDKTLDVSLAVLQPLTFGLFVLAILCGVASIVSTDVDMLMSDAGGGHYANSTLASLGETASKGKPGLNVLKHLVPFLRPVSDAY